VLLAERTWTDVDGESRPLLAVPIGSCEQHGPHLPLATDTIVAEALAGELARRRGDVVVGPTLTVTASGEHAGFAGTLSIGTPAMTQVVVELVRSADWSAGTVLVNGHGGNAEAVGDAVAVLAAEGRDVLSWWPAVAGGDAHAGRTETSLLLALRPELVHDDRLAAGATEPLSALTPTLRASGVRAVSPNGVLGDPLGAAAAEGHELFATLADHLVTAVEGWLAERVRR
jgi:mycofactocin system creatininase family protein